MNRSRRERVTGTSALLGRVGEPKAERDHHTRQREAGVAETLKKGVRVTGTQRDKLAADLRRKYDGGKSIRTIASETGRSYGFVHRLLSESGVRLRSRGGATRTKKARV
jgi:hypothetical protein